MAEFVEYRCTDCGYIHTELKGYRQFGIKPGTPFKDLPAEWACPVCGSTKDRFVVNDI